MTRLDRQLATISLQCAMAYIEGYARGAARTAPEGEREKWEHIRRYAEEAAAAEKQEDAAS